MLTSSTKTCHRGPDFGKKAPAACIFIIISGKSTHTSLLASYTRPSASMWATMSRSSTIGRRAFCACCHFRSSGAPSEEAQTGLRSWREFGFRGMVYETIRSAAILAGRYLDPFVWLTRKRAGWIITMSEAAASGFPASMSSKVLPLGNVGFSLEELPAKLRLPLEPSESGGPRDPVFLSAGRLVHWKGYSVLLKACAQLRRSGERLELWIAGTGPDESRLQ